ncbi:MAG: alkaline phosphatase [Endozoicomonadaceae bacterium]|nr:alkaline phosphatase [Endozoicomonadaceae bacterium]
MNFRNKLLTSLIIVGCTTMTGCAPDDSKDTVIESGKVKNIIMMIGDGMGPQQIGLLQTYAHRAPHSIYKGRPTGISRVIDAGVLGISSTGSHNKIVVDSAASATQLATGESTSNTLIGMNAQGDNLETIVEYAQRMKKATGLVSDTSLTDATPASFAAHQPHRNLENEIAVDMIRIGPDIMLSGGLLHFVPQSVNNKGATYNTIHNLNDGAFKISSQRKDDVNLLTEAKDSGYQLAFTREQMNQVKDGKLLGLFANAYMMDGINYTATKNSKDRTEPTLKEMTMKALDILSHNENGFFLMVEGGQIDWAGHENDVGSMLHEMIKFDEAVEAVYEWVAQRNDTLMIVTADHETGSFGLIKDTINDARTTPNLPTQSTSGVSDCQSTPKISELSILDRIYAQTRSNKNIWHDFEALPADQQTGKKLAKIMNQHHDFEVTSAMTATILAFKRPSSKKDKPTLGTEPRVNSFSVNGKNTHYNRMGHTLANYQHVAWGTGTHTDTPVLVIAFGPKAATAPFSKYLTHPEVGQLTKNSLE